MQRAKKMAHQLRALPSLKEDRGLSPSNQTVDQNCNVTPFPGNLIPSSSLYKHQVHM